ncbi:hypothetical protein DFH06DRAFT_1145919 [Mycena polygramma]|nr:hypothetical protein DFH06DRAFT_1145919 [Mycena polygramma]
MNPRESSRSCSHLKRLNLVFLQMVRRIATNLAKILLCLTVYRRVGALDNTSIWDAGSSVTDVRRAGLKTLLLSYILPRRLSFPSSRRGQATRERRGVRRVPGACTPRRCATGPLPARARLGSCRPQHEALMGRDARMRGAMGVVVMRQESIRRWLVIGPGTSAYQINASLSTLLQISGVYYCVAHAQLVLYQDRLEHSLTVLEGVDADAAGRYADVCRSTTPVLRSEAWLSLKHAFPGLVRPVPFPAAHPVLCRMLLRPSSSRTCVVLTEGRPTLVRSWISAMRPPGAQLSDAILLSLLRTCVLPASPADELQCERVREGVRCVAGGVRCANAAEIERAGLKALLPSPAVECDPLILVAHLRATHGPGRRAAAVAGTALGQPFVYGGGVNAHSTDAVRYGAMRCGRERLRETLLRCRSTTQVLTAATERELNIHLSHAAPVLRPRSPRPPLPYRRTGVRLRVYAVKLRAETEAETKRDLKNDQARLAPSSSRRPAVGRCPPTVRRVCDRSAHASANLRRDGCTSSPLCCLLGERTATTFRGTSLPLARDVRTLKYAGRERRAFSQAFSSIWKDVVSVGDAWDVLARIGDGEDEWVSQNDEARSPSSARRSPCRPSCSVSNGILLPSGAILRSSCARTQTCPPWWGHRRGELLCMDAVNGSGILSNDQARLPQARQRLHLCRHPCSMSKPVLPASLSLLRLSTSKFPCLPWWELRRSTLSCMTLVRWGAGSGALECGKEPGRVADGEDGCEISLESTKRARLPRPYPPPSRLLSNIMLPSCPVLKSSSCAPPATSVASGRVYLIPARTAFEYLCATRFSEAARDSRGEPARDPYYIHHPAAHSPPNVIIGQVDPEVFPGRHSVYLLARHGDDGDVWAEERVWKRGVSHHGKRRRPGAASQGDRPYGESCSRVRAGKRLDKERCLQHVSSSALERASVTPSLAVLLPRTLRRLPYLLSHTTLHLCLHTPQAEGLAHNAPSPGSEIAALHAAGHAATLRVRTTL